jgi:hypothetical protein
MIDIPGWSERTNFKLQNIVRKNQFAIDLIAARAAGDTIIREVITKEEYIRRLFNRYT